MTIATKPVTAVNNFVKTEWGHLKDMTLEAWDWAKANDWKNFIKKMFSRKYWGWWILVITIAVLSAVLSSYHEKIVLAIHPYVRAIRTAKWSWIVPTVLLIIVSFPPLFGHELIILVVGLVWGLGLGFVIACAGTFLGEVAVFFACKHWLRARAERIESSSLTYACLARLLRDGGLYMVTLVRFSAIPGHITTAIQSTVGIGFTLYALAAFLTLPKQFSLVYIGVIFGKVELTPHADENDIDPLDPNDPEPPAADLDARERHRQKMISFIVFAVTTLTTVIAAYVIYRNIRLVRDDVRRCMAAKQAELGLSTSNIEKDESAPRRSQDASRTVVDEEESDESDDEGADMSEKRRAVSFHWDPRGRRGPSQDLRDPRVRAVSVDEGVPNARVVEVFLPDGRRAPPGALWSSGRQLSALSSMQSEKLGGGSYPPTPALIDLADPLDKHFEKK